MTVSTAVLRKHGSIGHVGVTALLGILPKPGRRPGRPAGLIGCYGTDRNPECNASPCLRRFLGLQCPALGLSYTRAPASYLPPNDCLRVSMPFYRSDTGGADLNDCFCLHAGRPPVKSLILVGMSHMRVGNRCFGSTVNVHVRRPGLEPFSLN